MFKLCRDFIFASIKLVPDYNNLYILPELKEHMAMANGIERPLDLLNSSRGKEVIVQLKNDKQFVGTLRAFDIHINVVLDNTKEMQNGSVVRNLGLVFLRGDTIIYISPSGANS